MNNQSIKPKILVYQLSDSKVLEDYLECRGYEVIGTTSQNVMEKIADDKFDLCLIDHCNGLELLNSIRAMDGKIPILFVSGRFASEDIIEALRAGADDYMCIPVNLEELVTRIECLLRRTGLRTRVVREAYEIGAYTFSAITKTLEISGTKIKLSPQESELLALLCAYENDVLPRQTIMKQVWKDDNYYNKRSLDVHICKLRNYLKQDDKIALITIRGQGYSLVVSE